MQWCRIEIKEMSSKSDKVMAKTAFRLIKLNIQATRQRDFVSSSIQKDIWSWNSENFKVHYFKICCSPSHTGFKKNKYRRIWLTLKLKLHHRIPFIFALKTHSLEGWMINFFLFCFSSDHKKSVSMVSIIGHATGMIYEKNIARSLDSHKEGFVSMRWVPSLPSE